MTHLHTIKGIESRPQVPAWCEIVRVHRLTLASIEQIIGKIVAHRSV